MIPFILPYSRYDLGPPIFLGLVGCFLIFLGAMFYAVTVYQVILPERYLHLSIFTISSFTFLPRH